MAKRYRHPCPVCKKAGRIRYLTCTLTGMIGEDKHWVTCPDHGTQRVDYPTADEFCRSVDTKEDNHERNKS